MSKLTITKNDGVASVVINGKCQRSFRLIGYS
jgi:hypothetical protein